MIGTRTEGKQTDPTVTKVFCGPPRALYKVNGRIENNVEETPPAETCVPTMVPIFMIKRPGCAASRKDANSLQALNRKRRQESSTATVRTPDRRR